MRGRQRSLSFGPIGASAQELGAQAALPLPKNPSTRWGFVNRPPAPTRFDYRPAAPRGMIGRGKGGSSPLSRRYIAIWA